MAEPSDPTAPESTTGAPRWVKVSITIVALLLLVAVVVMLFSGGGHGPQRHGMAVPSIAVSRL